MFSALVIIHQTCLKVSSNKEEFKDENCRFKDHNKIFSRICKKFSHLQFNNNNIYGSLKNEKIFVNFNYLFFFSSFLDINGGDYNRTR